MSHIWFQEVRHSTRFGLLNPYGQPERHGLRSSLNLRCVVLMINIIAMRTEMKAILNDPKTYSSSPKNYTPVSQSLEKARLAPQSLFPGGHTYPNGEQVDNCDDHKEDTYPDGMVDAFSYRPIEERYPVIVAEPYQVGKSDELISGHNGVCKPDKSCILSYNKWTTACRNGESHQYIHPTAKPTPRSRNRRGNSIIGALTGISAVISPRQDITDEVIVPIRR